MHTLSDCVMPRREYSHATCFIRRGGHSSHRGGRGPPGHPLEPPLVRVRVSMGVDHRWTGGHVPPLFEVGDVICFVPPTFRDHLIIYMYYFTKFTTLVTIYLRSGYSYGES